MKWFGEEYYVVGYLPTGDTVVCSESGDLAKFANYEFLVDITPEEIKLISPEMEAIE